MGGGGRWSGALYMYLFIPPDKIFNKYDLYLYDGREAMTTELTFRAGELGKVFGVSALQVGRARRQLGLVEGEDWVGKDPVMYTSSGRSRLAHHFGAKVEGTDETGDVVTMVVARLFPNPIWVRCRNGGEWVNVRVRNSAYTPLGKRILCRREGGEWRMVNVRG